MNNTNIMPLVSVLMGTYNTNKNYLVEAVNSILHQTYMNIELIVIDDCSHEKVQDVLLNEGIVDSRLKVIRRNENMGLTKNLNLGLDQCLGKYVARMDADDIALPNRIEKQVYYMETHLDVDICGCFVEAFGGYSGVIGYEMMPVESFRTRLLFDNWGLIHPTVFFRISFLKKYHIQYDEKYRNAQDYKMWVEVAGLANIYCMKEILLLYRIHDKQAGGPENGDKSISFACMNRIEQLKKVSSRFTTWDEELHCNLSRISSKIPQAKDAKAYFMKLRHENHCSQFFNIKALDKEIAFQWIVLARRHLKAKDRQVLNCIFSKEMLKALRPDRLLFIWNCGGRQKLLRIKCERRYLRKEKL